MRKTALRRASDERTDCARDAQGRFSPGLDEFMVQEDADVEVLQGTIGWAVSVDAWTHGHDLDGTVFGSHCHDNRVVESERHRRTECSLMPSQSTDSSLNLRIPSTPQKTESSCKQPASAFAEFRRCHVCSKCNTKNISAYP